LTPARARASASALSIAAWCQAAALAVTVLCAGRNPGSTFSGDSATTGATKGGSGSWRSFREKTRFSNGMRKHSSTCRCLRAPSRCRAAPSLPCKGRESLVKGQKAPPHQGFDFTSRIRWYDSLTIAGGNEFPVDEGFLPSSERRRKWYRSMFRRHSW
jgi:hypothetical protein